MLLPDNIHPELSIYYNGSILLKELNVIDKQTVFNLYKRIKSKKGMSFPTFMLSLDWLYLINLVEVDEEGWVILCS